ncbi:hypothetical protein BDR03DRAFT_54169 [Suillus americanus]|nr:hypothetical protein BDR03DRAFT_54169 [Suillus americanus]
MRPRQRRRQRKISIQTNSRPVYQVCSIQTCKFKSAPNQVFNTREHATGSRYTNSALVGTAYVLLGLSGIVSYSYVTWRLALAALGQR